MSFFDQIGGKISSAGQETATKARNFAEATRLNGRIGDCEKQISQLYFEIGKAYYEKHMQDDAAEEIERIERIKNLNREIQQYREQVRELKGVMRCESCGAEIANGAAFCNTCGAKIVQQAPANASGARCPSCNAPIGPNVAFCTACGAKVEQPNTTADQQNTSAQQGTRCPNCNAPIGPNVAFCTTCGTKVEQQGTTAAVQENTTSASPNTADIQANTASTPQNAAAQQGRRCPNCNASIDSDAVFCVECGTKLS